ncbi:MAG TPA: hypothetical protein VIC87_12140 [Vicinamibacteria bacterium]|jgi:hypothetical protein
MKKALVLLAAFLVAAAYVGGLWPERQRRLALEGEARILEHRLEDAEARVRLCGLLAELHGLTEAVRRKNYDQAGQLSSRFFDHARAESRRVSVPAFHDSLEAVLHLRDPVTAGLARADPATLEQLGQAERRLQGLLGSFPPAAPPGEPLHRGPVPESTAASTPAPSPPD